MLVSGSSNGVFLKKCIHVYSKKKLYNTIGFFLLTANQVVTPLRPFLRKKKKKSFYIRSKFFFKVSNHCHISCFYNTSAILKKRLYVLGSVTLGPISRTIRRKKLLASFNYKFFMFYSFFSQTRSVVLSMISKTLSYYYCTNSLRLKVVNTFFKKKNLAFLLPIFFL